MGSSELDASLARELAALEAALLRRDITPLGDRIDFVTNDYLGLAGHAEITEAAIDALREYGAGGRAARLLGGGAACDREAERTAADWLDADDALLFPSGYQANLSLLPALAREGDVILSDALNHASLIDAARLSRARILVFEHSDLEHAARLLADTRGARRRLVVTEGVFSMDGDAADLAGLIELCETHDAHLVLDEAHAAGVIGASGAGAWEASGLDSVRLAARVLTGGKALGVAGAFVVGSHALRDHLVQRARGFVFSTALSPALSGALKRAIELSRDARERRERLRSNVCLLAETLGVEPPAAAILPVRVGPAGEALKVASRVREAGFEVRAVRPPTVPRGTSRLRIVLHAQQDPRDVQRLGEVVRQHVKAHTIPQAVLDACRPWAVVGTDTGIGKTVCSALLLLQSRRTRPAAPLAYWKPVQTGDDDDTAEVARLCGLDPAKFAAPGFSFPLPASPHEAAAAAGSEVDPSWLSAAYQEHARSGPLLIELAGGLLVPLTPDFTQADWLARHRPRIVLVARSGLGTLNHTLLSVEALRARRLEPEALLLVGEPHASNRETLGARSGIPLLVEVPPFDSLDQTALADWIAGGALDGIKLHG